MSLVHNISQIDFLLLLHHKSLLSNRFWKILNPKKKMITFKLKMKVKFGKVPMMTIKAKKVSKVEEAKDARASLMMNLSKASRWLNDNQYGINFQTMMISNKPLETKLDLTRTSNNPPLKVPWLIETPSNTRLPLEIQLLHLEPMKRNLSRNQWSLQRKKEVVNLMIE